MEQLMRRAIAHGGDVVIESLRAVGEVAYIQKHGGYVLGVDADPMVRYERITKRGTETDHVTYEEWLKQQERETNPDDPTKQDVFGALRASDVIIQNSTTLDNLYKAVDEFLESRIV